ncbi:hypothetical protein SDC9_169477 [bioreactor metagenome]|uniref:Uncharacterized protein n=1 Tax=bioreactor metagenome TaxID=1076179 RepID=A0A645GDK1_9ZZZZ
MAVFFAVERCGNGHSQCGGNGGGGVSGNKSIVFAFLWIGEARKASQFAVRMENITPPRKDFVSVGLMTNVPDQLVVRSVI